MTTQITQYNAQTELQLAWPLPATQQARAYLTWNEWTALQAASVARAQGCPLATSTQNQREIVARLDRRVATRLTWPLPATLASNARLSWAAWLEAQSRKPVAAQEDISEEVAAADQTAA
jgi:hypothetical protein